MPLGVSSSGDHEGRHTFASIGIAAGLNAKTLSTYLGHATITLNRYGHLMPGSEVKARAMLAPTWMVQEPSGLSWICRNVDDLPPNRPSATRSKATCL